jgi:cellulose synthase operon protein YhjU
MGLWSFYFLAKIYLCVRGYLGFHALPNVLLALGLALPWWFRRRAVPRAALVAHGVVGLVAAFALLWHDSFLPPLASSVEFLRSPATRPSAGYLLSFLSGYWNAGEAAALAAILAVAYAAHRKRVAIGPVVLLLMAVPAILSAARATPTVAGVVEKFYSEQKGDRHVTRIAAPAPDAPPFDVIFLHTCSLSWDDLAHAGIRGHPFLSEFDLLLSRFNTATSYSNPATLRLLRSGCGQTSHTGLFMDLPAKCYLFEALRGAGYATYTLFNHRGSYSDSMADHGHRYGKAPLPEALPEPPVKYLSFDASPIYENYPLLEAWWKRRLASGAARAALYYNNVTLHGGVHVPSDTKWYEHKDRHHYQERAAEVFADYRRFFSLVQESGRDALVIMIPEHGAALVGNRIQARDLRDIPLPQITTVPVGIKFIQGSRPPGGNDRRPAKALRLDKPVSYEAVAYLVSQALRNRAGAQAPLFPEDSLAGIPETPLVAENENAKIIEHEGAVYYQGKDQAWTRIADSNPPDNPTTTETK